MNNQEFITSITEFSESKNIDRPTLISMLQDMFHSLIDKRYGSHDNFEININPNKGELHIWRYRKVVADATQDKDPRLHIPLSEAQKIEPDFEEGEEVAEPISIEQFDRRDITQGLQVFTQKEQKIEQNQLYEKYKKLVGKIIHAEVYHITSHVAILHDSEKNSLLLPRSKQIPGELLKEGTQIKALVEEVNPKNSQIRIILSRTSPFFLEQLLMREIPEIADKIVTINKIARLPGIRSKVAVSSQDDRIDPVGACIGTGGNRIHSLGKHELHNELISIVQYTDNKSILLKRLMEPVDILHIKEEKAAITITIRPDQVPLAIGKKGQNIFLAGQILGKPIEIDRQTSSDQEDLHLKELLEQVDEKIIEQLKKVGIDTAKALLYADPKDLIRRTGLTEQELTELRTILLKKSSHPPKS